MEVVEKAMARLGRTHTFYVDQRSPFTSREFTVLLIGASIEIRMDGKPGQL